MAEAIRSNAAGEVSVVAGLDLDDESDYEQTVGDAVVSYRGDRKSLCGWTNHLAAQVVDGPNPPRYLASLGDDHRVRTPGWDLKLIEAVEQMDGPGFAYGNDLLQGKNMPTAWVVSAEIVRMLGWMMLPGCEHMYVDNAVLTLGSAANRIAYRPDVVIEHLHPLAGKAEWDASYRESNADERYTADRAAFETWRRNRAGFDAARVAAIRRPVTELPDSLGRHTC
jgi:hypothetical protein